jgi:membrane protease YdiL (CAAX protease family)
VDEVLARVLVGVIVAATLAEAVLGSRFGARLLRWCNDEPAARARFYRRGIALSWIRGAAAALAVAASADLTAADVGWAWPGGDGLDVALAGFFLLASTVRGLRARRLLRDGHAIAARARVAPLVPRTAVERRLAGWLCLSAGVTEEFVFRGLLIAAGTDLFGLPAGAAVLASGVVFVGAHTYQGTRGLPGIVALTFILTAIYLISDSLLLPALVHGAHNLIVLLLIPAGPRTARVLDRTGPGMRE